MGEHEHEPPTDGRPPDALLLSGVLLSQSLMRPATPVFITAASCLKMGPKVSESSGAVEPVSPFPHHHLAFYLELSAAAPGRGEHAAFLPHALDVSYAVGDYGQIHGSGARGSGLLVLPLQRQSGRFELAVRQRNVRRMKGLTGQGGRGQEIGHFSCLDKRPKTPKLI